MRWKVESPCDGLEGRWIDTETDKRLFYVEDGNGCEAEMRLALAAPNLLEALERALAEAPVHYIGCEQAPCDCWRKLAKDAIAMAKGIQP